MSLRMVGMLVAGVLFGAVLALIGLAYLTAPPPVQHTQPTFIAPTPDTQPTTEPLTDNADQGQPNVADTEPININAITSGTEPIRPTVEDWTWRFANAKGEAQAIVRMDRFDPKARGEYEVTNVRVTFFRENRIMRMRAAKGEIRGQRNEQPESGQLTGNVSLAMYPEGVTEAQAIAFERGESDAGPQIEFTTESMRFDTTLAQGIAPEDVRITAPGVRLDGRGLTLRFGTSADSDATRLLLVRLEESDGLQLWPDRFPESNDRPSARSDEATERAAPSEDVQETPDPPTIYQFTMDDRVAISRGSYSVRADRLEAFARFFGDGLRENAIARVRLRPSDESTPETGTGPSRDPFVSGDDGLPTGAPILVTWNGPLELRPVLDPPGVLDYDDVALRFSSRDEGGVRLGDDLTGTGLSARMLTYFASSAFFEARANVPNGVEMGARDVAQITTSALDIDLSESPLAFATMSTPGRAEDAQGRSATWGGRAEFEADLTEDQLTPRDLTLTGGVDLASKDGASATSDNLRLTFSGEGQVERLEAWGDVLAQRTEGRQSVSGDRATLRFKPTPEGDAALSEISVTDGATARDGDRSMHADSILTTFADDAPVSVDAEGSVRVDLGQGMGVTCDRVRSDREAETIDLIGSETAPVIVTHDRNGVRLNASIGSARIEEAAQRVTGFGAGTGRLNASDPRARYESAALSWGGGFVFDGTDGLLEMLGGVEIDAKKDDTETHRAAADRVEIQFEDLDEQARVISARLFAGPGPDGEERHATAEARRTRPDPQSETGRALESLLAIRSGELIVDTQRQTVDAPGAGRLVVEDRRENDADAPNAETRGTSVFTWTGAMGVDLDAGRATLERDVVIRHRAPAASDITELECRRLTARLLRSGAGGAFGVERLDATGSVFAGYQGLELLGDTMTYLSAQERILVEAGEGNRVTVFDPGRGGHFTAKSVSIDLATGNWKSEEATGSAGAP